MNLKSIVTETCPDCGESKMVFLTDEGVTNSRHRCGDIAAKMRALIEEYGEDAEITITGEFG